MYQKILSPVMSVSGFTFPRDDISSVVTLPGGGIEVCIGKFNLCRDVFQYHNAVQGILTVIYLNVYLIMMRSWPNK